MKMEFTKKDLLALAPDRVKVLNFFDLVTPGLALRITPAGVRTFVFKYQIGSRQVWLKIGRFGDVTLDEAKKRVTFFRQALNDGKDPAKEIKEKRNAMTVKQAAEKMLGEHAPHVRKSTFADYEHLVFGVVIPALGNISIRDLAPADVGLLHHSLRETPRKANVTLVVVSLICKYAEEWGERELGTNPCQHRKRFQTGSRSRYLSPKELLAIGGALDELESSLGFSSADCLRLIILTGARKGEITSLRWEQVDLDRKRLGFNPSQHKTGGVTYSKQIPLGDAAVDLLQVLQQRRTLGNPWVFPGRNPESSVRTVDKAWYLVRDKASERADEPDGIDVRDVHIHDLRHTWGSTATSAGYSLQIIGAVMGHKHQATTQRYAHVAPSPAAEVAQATTAKLASALGLKDPRGPEAC